MASTSYTWCGMSEPTIIERVHRFDDAGTTKDLFETDSRVLYTASTVTPGTGYLMYIRARKSAGAPIRSQFPAGNR